VNNMTMRTGVASKAPLGEWSVMAGDPSRQKAGTGAIRVVVHPVASIVVCGVAGGKSDALAAPAPVATRRGSKVKSCATRATFILHMTNLLGVRLSVIMLNVRIAVEITAYCPLDMADCVCMTFLRIDRIDAVPGVPAKGAANAVR